MTALHQLLAENAGLLHIGAAMDLLNQNFLWANCIWGAIASGYLIYGWRQRAAIPFVGGAVMSVASCFLPALPMSLVCIFTMAVVYWLVKQGY
jgi:hypothetical protein